MTGTIFVVAEGSNILGQAKTREDGIGYLRETYGDDKFIEVGSPLISGAKVEAELVKNGKNRTILIFKKRRRHNSRRKNGHRQEFSLIRISKIFAKDGKVLSEAPKVSSPLKKKEVKTK